MTKLLTIIRASQDIYPDMSVTVNSNHGVVAIVVPSLGVNMALLGDDAHAFYSEANELWNTLEVVSMSECYHYLAIDYVHADLHN